MLDFLRRPSPEEMQNRPPGQESRPPFGFESDEVRAKRAREKRSERETSPKLRGGEGLRLMGLNQTEKTPDIGKLTGREIEIQDLEQTLIENQRALAKMDERNPAYERTQKKGEQIKTRIRVLQVQQDPYNQDEQRQAG
ncbi:MAG: hypothetical protein Q8P30_02940 [Candidatus Uhrbacteria bacterium]|nr:hypothetical protein [Candidatus Uhrbacteria bacterium]